MHINETLGGSMKEFSVFFICLQNLNFLTEAWTLVKTTYLLWVILTNCSQSHISKPNLLINLLLGLSYLNKQLKRLHIWYQLKYNTTGLQE